jgi:hypothetical protein
MSVSAMSRCTDDPDKRSRFCRHNHHNLDRLARLAPQFLTEEYEGEMLSSKGQVRSKVLVMALRLHGGLKFLLHGFESTAECSILG